MNIYEFRTNREGPGGYIHLRWVEDEIWVDNHPKAVTNSRIRDPFTDTERGSEERNWNTISLPVSPPYLSIRQFNPERHEVHRLKILRLKTSSLYRKYLSWQGRLVDNQEEKVDQTVHANKNTQSVRARRLVVCVREGFQTYCRTRRCTIMSIVIQYTRNIKGA